MSDTVLVQLTVNGQSRQGHCEPRKLLVDFLREDLGLTGTHVGCEHGICGACTILVDGEAARSCLMLAVQADGAELGTVEGLMSDGKLHPLQEAFIDASRRIGDYVRTTGDAAEAERHWPVVRAIVARYLGFAAGGALPLKPRNDRDWADNVYREGLVAYDLGLFVGALDVVATLGLTLDVALSQQAKAAAAAARKAIDDTLWVEARHGYADYRTPDGFVEDHLTLDSLTLARFDGVSPDRAKRLLLAVETSLESRNNAVQPYGDWGVLCAYPPFKRPADLRAKSAFAYRYHNGSDWPYWDGVYAEERSAAE